MIALSTAMAFLLKLSNEFTFDPILDTKVCKGELYVTQRTNDIILYE